MKTVEDMIKLEKNVCLTRNFHLITKENKQYVDVWLVHFFEKPNEIGKKELLEDIISL